MLCKFIDELSSSSIILFTSLNKFGLRLNFIYFDSLLHSKLFELDLKTFN